MPQPHLIKFTCSKCKRAGYWSTKNKKQVERKLEFSKFCSWCKAHTKHKETKK